MIYATILFLISAAVLTSLSLRKPYRVDIVRDRGTLTRIIEDEKVENVFRLHVMNATEQSQHYVITVNGLPGVALTSDAPLTVGPTESRWIPLRVQAPQQTAAPGSHPITFDIKLLGTDKHVVEKAVFMIPH
jgi:polyferredoxin